MTRPASLSIVLVALTAIGLGACLPPILDPGEPRLPRTHALVQAPRTTPSLDRVIPELAGKQVVFVGETHDRFEHHLVQLEIIRRLHALHPTLVIGMEFFQRPFQKYLDAFMAGELDEKSFLKKTEYFQRWGFDYRLYRPILDYARRHRIALLALNIPSEILRKVARSGLEALDGEDKAQVPAQIDQSDTLYRERLKEVYRQHGRPEDELGFERFWQAQLLWDETMAETAADYLKRNPGRPMVILAGAGHLAYGAGIPRRLARRQPVTSAIVLNGEGNEAAEPGKADYLLKVERVELPAAGRLGIVMEAGPAGVLIKEVQPGSGSMKAGLQAGDQIVKLDGQAVSDPADIQIALLDRQPGDSVELLGLKAQKPGGKQEFNVTVRLNPARL